MLSYCIIIILQVVNASLSEWHYQHVFYKQCHVAMSQPLANHHLSIAGDYAVLAMIKLTAIIIADEYDSFLPLTTATFY